MSIYKDYWTKPTQKTANPVVVSNTQMSNYVKNVVYGNAALCKRESILSD